MNELEVKLERARELMAERKIDALWLRLASSFAWATCGKSAYINTASSYGAASVLITQDRRYIITNNIEEPRLAEEEGLRAAGWEFPADQWYAPTGVVARLADGDRVAVDDGTAGLTDLSGPVARLRANLCPKKMRAFGRWGVSVRRQ